MLHAVEIYYCRLVKSDQSKLVSIQKLAKICNFHHYGATFFFRFRLIPSLCPHHLYRPCKTEALLWGVTQFHDEIQTPSPTWGYEMQRQYSRQMLKHDVHFRIYFYHYPCAHMKPWSAVCQDGGLSAIFDIPWRLRIYDIISKLIAQMYGSLDIAPERKYKIAAWQPCWISDGLEIWQHRSSDGYQSMIKI